MVSISKKWSDNALENYFLDLLVQKHIIDREIQDLLTIIEKSPVHTDYQLLIKRLLFGEKNIYIENWGTLGSSLQDMIASMDIRGNNVSGYGIILQMMVRIIEKIFDINDENFHDFILSEEKEDVEHQLIILMKRVLDFMEIGLKDILEKSTELVEPRWEYLKDEYLVIEATLKKYPITIMQSEKENINKVKISVDEVAARIHDRKIKQRF